jgi:hypothetical protein
MAPTVPEDDRTPGPARCRKLVTRGFVVGVRGFEPPASTSRMTSRHRIVCRLVWVHIELAGTSRLDVPARPAQCRGMSNSLAPTMAPKIRLGRLDLRSRSCWSALWVARELYFEAHEPVTEIAAQLAITAKTSYN